MTSVQIISQVSIGLDQLLNGVAQLETADLEHFVAQVNLLLAQRKATALPHREAELLEHINRGLPDDIQQRYNELQLKLHHEAITPTEQQELLSLIDIVEQASANRLQHLIELSQLRQISLDELMTQLGIHHPLFMPRRYITTAEQQQIIDRAKGRCEYCKSTIDHSPQSFACEHIVPLAEGGATTLDNLALSCGGCNGHKYTRTQALDPISLVDVPLYHPRQQIWQDHFGWSNDFLTMIGLTATGRATANALKLNRPGVVNLRRLLILANLHPPGEN